MNRLLILAAALLTLLAASSSQATRTHQVRASDDNKYAVWMTAFDQKQLRSDDGATLKKSLKKLKKGLKKWKAELPSVMTRPEYKQYSRRNADQTKRNDRYKEYMAQIIVDLSSRISLEMTQTKTHRYADIDVKKWENAVPEPSAALVFGLGTLVVGSSIRRR